MKYLTTITYFILLVLSETLYGQYYDTGQDPGKLKWLQIKTGRFKVIYPEVYGSQGIKFARELEKSYSELTTLFPVKKFKLPVIIHNFTTQSNGYVAWAPKRMELYPTPEQNSIPLDPDRQLALHEMTHVMQMEMLNTGFSKAMSFIAGQQFTGAIAALLPLWYMEGDAVYSETLFTQSGRGRSPSFQKYLKAISVEKGHIYKYDKIVNGSFRDFIPDYYQSGYQIASWVHTRFNPQTWNKVLRLTGNAPFLIDPSNISLLHNTGLTKRNLYRESFDTLTKKWSDEIILNNAKPYKAINPEKRKSYINYYSPVRLGDKMIAAVKTSLYNPPEFVLINKSEGSEERLYIPGYLFPFYISAGNMLLVWVEYQPDPRWDNRNYSVIKLMDLRARTVKQLSWKSRYMSASISPNGKTIVATENTVDNNNNLILINTSSGKIIKSIPVPGNAYLQRPQWSDDGTMITLISLTEKGEGIISFTLSDLSWKRIIPEGPVDYQSSFSRHDSLFFVSSVSGTENLYVLTPGNKTRKLTNSRFGATDLLIEGSSIMFCDYTSKGNEICIASLKNDLPDEVNKVAPFFLINQAPTPSGSEKKESEVNFTPVRYRKWQHLFGFHSWMPFYADLEVIKSDPTAVRPGLTLFSQNQLSTLNSTFGYEYSGNRHKFHSSITWSGWYPVLESRIDYGNQPIISKPNNISYPSIINEGIFYTNTISLPLIFTSGKFSLFIRPSASTAYQNNYLYSTENSSYDYGQTQFSGRFYFSNSYISAERDIFPRLAQVVDFNVSSYPFDKKFFGNDLTLRTAFFLPGILHNNVIRIRYENEYQTIVKFLNMNMINFPRGYKFQNNYKNVISEELNFLSCDYIMPLFYPDFNISSLFYLKRIRSGLFYDYARGNNNYYLTNENGSLIVKNPTTDIHRYQESFSTYGVELISDFHVFRLPYMVSAGIQAAWQKGEQTPSLKMIFNVNIYGMNIGRNRM